MHKLSFVFSCIVLALVVITLKLFYIQVIAANSYSENRYLTTTRITPERGELFDRNGEPLVINRGTYKLFFSPQEIKDTDTIVKKVDEVTKLGEATISARIQKEKKWVAVTGGLTLEQKEQLEKSRLSGIGFEKEVGRYYPEASLSAQLTGFLGKDTSGNSTGYFGIEGYYEKDLTGLPGLFKSERDVVGKPIVVGVQEVVPGENGRDLYLTIDKTVQRIIKTNLQKGLEKYGAVSGCVIVMEPYTGEIIGMSCLPDFDPSHFRDFSETYFKNPAISDVFEPGSIFKPLVMAAALNEKSVKITDTFRESGPIQIGQYTIDNWDKRHDGEISMTQILEKSSNLGMVYVGSKLSQDKMSSYLTNYGFGQKTGIDLQGEVSSSLRKRWAPIDSATVSFGQGIAVTPIQMITSFSSLVNGGWLMKPYIVKKIVSESGESRIIESKRVRRVIDSHASDQIKRMLEQVVMHGEVKWKIPKGYRIGGKTGTAQIAVEGQYDGTKTIASFMGFAPVEKPRFVIMVTLREPSSSIWGSETAAPLFFDILQELLMYYTIAPTS